MLPANHNRKNKTEMAWKGWGVISLHDVLLSLMFAYIESTLLALDRVCLGDSPKWFWYAAEKCPRLVKPKWLAISPTLVKSDSLRKSWDLSKWFTSSKRISRSNSIGPILKFSLQPCMRVRLELNKILLTSSSLSGLVLLSNPQLINSQTNCWRGAISNGLNDWLFLLDRASSISVKICPAWRDRSSGLLDGLFKCHVSLFEISE